VPIFYKNIDDNLKLEPEWAKGNLPNVRNALSKLKSEIKNCSSFADKEQYRNEDFINIFNGKLNKCEGLIGIMNEISGSSESWVSWRIEKR
jgi:hypothetical protein